MFVLTINIQFSNLSNFVRKLSKIDQRILSKYLEIPENWIIQTEKIIDNATFTRLIYIFQSKNQPSYRKNRVR